MSGEVVRCEITLPVALLGDTVSQLNRIGAVFNNGRIAGTLRTFEAEIPDRELKAFADWLANLSKGAATISIKS